MGLGLGVRFWHRLAFFEDDSLAGVVTASKMPSPNP